MNWKDWLFGIGLMTSAGIVYLTIGAFTLIIALRWPIAVVVVAVLVVRAV